jgi:two-component system chemotaxis response regulator CheB
MTTVSIVVIGASLGGPVALKMLLAGLPRGFRPPVVIVQHRPKGNGELLVSRLRQASALPVLEPDDKAPLDAGHVYLAPADYHLLVEAGSLALSIEAPVNNARPSIDVLFESAAEAYGSGVIGVILTGANRDGASGCVHIKQCGGVVLVQAVEDAECGVMPAAAIAGAKVDRILPLSRIHEALCQLCRPAPGGHP